MCLLIFSLLFSLAVSLSTLFLLICFPPLFIECPYHPSYCFLIRFTNTLNCSWHYILSVFFKFSCSIFMYSGYALYFLNIFISQACILFDYFSISSHESHPFVSIVSYTFIFVLFFLIKASSVQSSKHFVGIYHHHHMNVS